MGRVIGRLLTILATALAIVVGLLVLIGLLAGNGVGGLGLLIELATQAAGAEPGQGIAALNVFTSVALRLAVVTIGVTLLMGLLNLLGVHLRRVAERRNGFPYSLVLIISAALVIGLRLAGDMPGAMVLLQTVQVSVESALAALIPFALIYGAYRLMRRRVSAPALLFTLAVLIVLIGALPLNAVGFMTPVRDWLLAVPVSAGARGILLGIALATLVAGVRLLIGQDRTYRE